MYLRGFDISGFLECESSFAGGLRERLHAAVVHEPAAVEDDEANAFFLRSFGQRLADQPGNFALLFAIAYRFEIGFEVASRDERVARTIVNELCVNVVQAAEDG